MTTLTCWAGDGPTVLTGTATYTVGNRVVQVRLNSYRDAAAISELLEVAGKRGRVDAHAVCARYIRAAATHLEQSE